MWLPLKILLLSFTQNVAFSMWSRSRNRDHMGYQVGSNIFATVVWFMTFKELIKSDMSWDLLPPYTLGTTLGVLLGVKVSMRIEIWLDASSDRHLNSKRNPDE